MLTKYRFWLVALGLFAVELIVLWAFAAWVVNPVEEAADHVVAPVLKAASIISGVCPDGFKDASDKDEHGRVSACFLGDNPKAPKSGDYIISLNSEGFCSHAIQVDVPRPRLECSEVPGWPQ